MLPLAETCADIGAQVIVGTRRRDDGGDLLGRFGGALDLIDLDDPGYFAEEDLAAYALACLQLTGDERPGNPYADQALAEPLAARIAELSGQNFLIAGLIARSHGLHDETAASPGQLQFDATVDSALAAYLDRLSPVAGLPAATRAHRSCLRRGTRPARHAVAAGSGSPLRDAHQRRRPDPVRPVLGGELPRGNRARHHVRPSRAAMPGARLPAVPPGAQRRPAARPG